MIGASSQKSGFASQPATVKEKLQQHHIGLSKSALVEALRNPDPEVRGLAAVELAGEKAEDAIPEIVHAANEETQPMTRINMAASLTWLGEQTGYEILKDTCHNSGIPGHLRMTAASYLLDVNDGSCLDAALSVLESDSEGGSRMQALSLLPKFKKVSEADSRKIYTLSIKALTDPVPAVRITASNTLVDLGNRSAIPELQNAIVAEHDEVIRSAIEVNLHRLEEKKAEKKER